ncbi:MAG TPA: gamma-glutamyltransferase, partial [Pilimelia sp.]|nr:gamma-glutamyltransferase [Pilimelia sp.]
MRHQVGHLLAVTAARLRVAPGGPRLRHRAAARLTAAALAVPLVALVPAPAAAVADPPRHPVARGHGGAVATVDPTATAAGLAVLRGGGNAVDAALAAAATLGVTEPFSAGIGGGGFFVYYDARQRRVHTVDGRETAPAATRPDVFVDPATGRAMDFTEARVSGLSVGVPGTLATWYEAARRWGTRPVRRALEDAAGVAAGGFTVDQTFRDHVAENQAAFAQFHSSRALYLPGGAPPRVGTVHRNPDLARTYRQLARRGPAAFYRGAIGRDLVDAVRRPPLAADRPAWPHAIRPGAMAM